MSRVIIPKNAGREFKIITSYAGTPLILNDKKGKSSVKIPCRDREQAEELCEKLRLGDHNGEIWF